MRPVAAVSPVYGFLKDSTESISQYSDFCSLTPSKTLPKGGMLVVVRRTTCTSKYGASFSKPFMEVLYAGKRVFVAPDAVSMSEEDSRKFDALDPSQIEASAEAWERASLSARLVQLERATDSLKATSKQGIAILKSRIFDVSEHTEGTGFEVTVYNSGRKTIKYVTFSVTGLNAVNDPVRDRLRNTTAPMLRGIGPIEPGDTGSYTKDYMWMTDIVESFRISQIKLEYTDGTTKILTDTKGLRISERDYGILSTSVD